MKGLEPAMEMFPGSLARQPNVEVGSFGREHWALTCIVIFGPTVYINLPS